MNTDEYKMLRGLAITMIKPQIFDNFMDHARKFDIEVFRNIISKIEWIEHDNEHVVEMYKNVIETSADVMFPKGSEDVLKSLENIVDETYADNPKSPIAIVMVMNDSKFWLALHVLRIIFEKKYKLDRISPSVADAIIMLDKPIILYPTYHDDISQFINSREMTKFKLAEEIFRQMVKFSSYFDDWNVREVARSDIADEMIRVFSVIANMNFGFSVVLVIPDSPFETNYDGEHTITIGGNKSDIQNITRVDIYGPYRINIDKLISSEFRDLFTTSRSGIIEFEPYHALTSPNRLMNYLDGISDDISGVAKKIWKSNKFRLYDL